MVVFWFGLTWKVLTAPGLLYKEKDSKQSVRKPFVSKMKYPMAITKAYF